MRERQRSGFGFGPGLVVLTLFLLLLAACGSNSPTGAVLEEGTPASPPESATTVAEAMVEGEVPAEATPVAKAGLPPEGPQHFVGCAFRTGQNAIIGVPAEVTLPAGVVLEPGDEVAVYNDDGSVCAGASMWLGANIAITAWGDDSQTEIIDGLQEGEPLRFRLWDASAEREVELREASYIEGDGFYRTDGIYVVGALSP